MDIDTILQNDVDYNRFVAQCDEQHFAHMERNHPAFETLAAVKRATGFDAVAISFTDPDFDAKMRAARDGWRRQS